MMLAQLSGEVSNAENVGRSAPARAGEERQDMETTVWGCDMYDEHECFFSVTITLHF